MNKNAVQPSASSFQSAWGDVRVTSQTTGYKIIQRATQAVLGFGKVDLPEQMLETQACWLVCTKDLIERLKAAAWYSDPNEYGANWPAQREAARARDGYCCQGCGMVEMPGRQHDVHHRIPFRAFLADPTFRGGLAQECAWQAANVLENLISLCPACHRQTEAGVRIRSGLGGAATLLAGIAPIFLMCDPATWGCWLSRKRDIRPADDHTLRAGPGRRRIRRATVRVNAGSAAAPLTTW